MTKKTKVKLVKDAEVWQDMAGDSALEKRINSYLTCQFILCKDVPADECLSEAKEIIKLVQEY